MDIHKISFDNTEIAFSSRSDKDLRKTHLLFSVMNNKFIVKTGTYIINLALKLKLPVHSLVKGAVFKQFCGGESIKECDQVISQLQNYNIGAILDYAVEGEDNEEDFDSTCSEILRAIEKAGKTKNIPFSVFKPTGVASKELLIKIQEKQPLTSLEIQHFDNVKQRFDRICRHAFENNVRLFIDSEESWYQDVVDELVYEMMLRYNIDKPIVFNTFQMYRHEMLENLKKAFKKSIEEKFYMGAKLVRGAYMEKERKRAVEKGYQDPINATKVMTDQAFNDALEFCIQNINHISVCCGSHNEASNYHMIRLIEKYGLSKNDERIFSAQLFGMSDHISYNLASAGYNITKYVPYGPVEKVIPYLIRRAEENSAIAGQSSRELQLIKKEINRRKHQ